MLSSSAKITIILQHTYPLTFPIFCSIYVVSNVTATMPDGPSENVVTTHGNNQYLVFSQNDQRTILVPLRSETPPPSYKDLFGTS